MNHRSIETRKPAVARVAPDPRADPVRDLDLRVRMAVCEGTIGRPQPVRRFGANGGRYWLSPDAVGALRIIRIFRGTGWDALAGRFRSRHRSQKQLNVVKEYCLVAVERYRCGPVNLRAASLTTPGL